MLGAVTRTGTDKHGVGGVGRRTGGGALALSAAHVTFCCPSTYHPRARDGLMSPLIHLMALMAERNLAGLGGTWRHFGRIR